MNFLTAAIAGRWSCWKCLGGPKRCCPITGTTGFAGTLKSASESDPESDSLTGLIEPLWRTISALDVTWMSSKPTVLKCCVLLAVEGSVWENESGVDADSARSVETSESGCNRLLGSLWQLGRRGLVFFCIDYADGSANSLTTSNELYLHHLSHWT